MTADLRGRCREIAAHNLDDWLGKHPLSEIMQRAMLEFAREVLLAEPSPEMQIAGYHAARAALSLHDVESKIFLAMAAVRAEALK